MLTDCDVLYVPGDGLNVGVLTVGVPLPLQTCHG
jgi:hypothetical protein